MVVRCVILKDLCNEYKNTLLWSASALTFLLLAGSTSAMANDFSWTGVVDNDALRADNYSPALPSAPGAQDRLLFHWLPGKMPNTPQINGDGLWVYNVEVGTQGSFGSLNIVNGELSTQYGKTLSIAADTGSSGEITVRGASSVLSTLNNAGRMTVGASGDATLNILEGGVVNFSVTAGDASGAAGKVIIDGAGSQLNAKILPSVFGKSGTGTLEIKNGGLYAGGPLTFADEAGSRASATINGQGSTVDLYGFNVGGDGYDTPLSIGGRGTATVSVENGGRIINVASLCLGCEAGGKGTLIIDGAGSLLAGQQTSSVSVYVGFSGEGEIIIRNGGLVTTAYMHVGQGGNVVVEGPNSKWDTPGRLMDMYGGSLIIRDGGHVNVGRGFIGDKAGQLATVTVDGRASGWNVDYLVELGTTGDGKATVTNGGTVVSSNIYLGEKEGSSGSLAIKGSGSSWSVIPNLIYGNYTGSIYIAESGSGFVTISDGAVINVADRVTIGRYAAGTGILNIGAAAGEAAVAPGKLDTPTLTFGAGSGHLVFNHTDVSGDYEFAPVMTGGNTSSTLDVYNGNTVLTGIGSDYSAATNVHNGILSAGNAGVFSANSGFTVDTAGRLDLRGHDQTIAGLANSGTVDFGGAGGTTLNVAGNYTSNNGTLVINSVLGDDDSVTDMLHVHGDASGSSKLFVNNVGGEGDQTVGGIKVVQIDGQSNGSFALANGYTTKDGKQAVSGGAYAYTLQQGSGTGKQDGNWYLTSQLDGPGPKPDPDCNLTNSCPQPVPPATRYSAGVPVYEGYLQNMQALNKLPTLQERVGERYWTGKNGDGQTNGAAVDDKGVWARIEGAHNRLEPDTSLTRMKQDINTFIMQAGVDGQFYEGETGKLIAGITGQYGHAKGDISSFHGDGAISTDGWSLGATATWYGNSGFYVDGQAQVTWFDSDLNSWTANQGLADGRKATGYALSVEAGQRIALDQNWSLTPQAQLIYSSINADSFRDAWDSRVSLHDGDSLIGRIGIAANYANSWKGEDGLMVNTSVYGIANLYQEMLGGSSVNVAGVDFDTDNDRTWGGIGAGGTYAWADNKYAIYGEGSINTALNQFADSYSLKGTVGFKVKW